MCTVTLVPHAQGFRLACNRDERTERAAAEPPMARRLGRRLAWFPLDPVGPGTWIGANDAGLAIALLNEQDEHADRPHLRSRGLLIPRLLEEDSCGDALEALRALDLQAFRPFTMVIARRRQVIQATSDGSVLDARSRILAEPALFASSSWRTSFVRRSRRRLFESLVRRSNDPLAAQRAFHAHSWPCLPEASVVMRRPEARTVSRTFVDVAPSAVRMTYEVL